jgi:adenylate cyclase
VEGSISKQYAKVIAGCKLRDFDEALKKLSCSKSRDYFRTLSKHCHIKRFYSLILLLLALGARAQSPDELERSTAEVDMLLEKARLSESRDERQRFAEQSLTIARNLRYDGGIIRADLVLGEIAIAREKTEEALQYYLEAEAKVQNTGNKALLQDIYTALGNLFYEQKLYSGARRYYNELLNVQPGNTEIQEKVADAFLADLVADSAEMVYKKLILKFRESGDTPHLIKIYQKLARAYDQKGDAGKSLYYYLPIEDLIEKYGSLQEKAILYNNLGRQYVILRDYKKALEYFKKSEDYSTYLPADYPEVLYANMGVAYSNMGQTQLGIDYLLRAREILARRKDEEALANLEHLIASVYFNNNDLYNALAHNNTAIRLAKDTKQTLVLAETYRTAAELYHDLYDFENAFVYYKNYLNLLDSVRLEEQGRQQRLNQQRTLLAAAEGQIKYLIARQNFKDLELAQVRFERERLELLNKNLELETRRKEDELLILQKQKEVDQAKLREQTLQALRARQELRLAAQQLDAARQDRLIADLKRQEEIDRARSHADSSSRAQELEILRRDKNIADLERARQSTFRSFAYGIGILFLIILGLLAAGWWFTRRTNSRLNKQNRQIQAQNLEIAEERRKSESLLLNILPEEIADELKTKGYATPKYYESATVLFTDFVNFTKLSSHLSPDELIDELNECFLAFDEICDKFGLEKIKTIGDAYMCAGGLPVPNTTHPEDAVKAALEMNAWLQGRNATKPGAVFREMRIGVHTGPVVAGVIGKNKFAYDIWGDAVNLAARLEENGEPGRVNISVATAQAVRHAFKISNRGHKEVHNKGMVEMFFVE